MNTKRTHEANPVILRDDPVDKLHLAEDSAFPALSRSQQQQLYFLLLRLIVLSKSDNFFWQRQALSGCIGEVTLCHLCESYFSFRDGSASVEAAQKETQIKPTRSVTADRSNDFNSRSREKYVVGSQSQGK